MKTFQLLSVLFSIFHLSFQRPLEIIVPLQLSGPEAETFPLVAAVLSSRESGVQSVESREDVAVKAEEQQVQPSETPQVVKEEAPQERPRELTISLPEVTDKPKLNVLEVLKGMGSAIQLLIRQPQQSSLQPGGLIRSESAQSAVVTESSPETREHYRQQAEILRTEISKRAGQLQSVVGTAVEALRNRGESVVVMRILENLHIRLGQAKQRADKILSEPESGELAIKTLNSINQGMGNLGQLVQHVLSRVNISINVDLKDKNVSSTPATAESQPTPSSSS